MKLHTEYVYVGEWHNGYTSRNYGVFKTEEAAWEKARLLGYHPDDVEVEKHEVQL